MGCSSDIGQHLSKRIDYFTQGNLIIRMLRSIIKAGSSVAITKLSNVCRALN